MRGNESKYEHHMIERLGQENTIRIKIYIGTVITQIDFLCKKQFISQPDTCFRLAIGYDLLLLETENQLLN